jgi:hypothetical protein
MESENTLLNSSTFNFTSLYDIWADILCQHNALKFPSRTQNAGLIFFSLLYSGSPHLKIMPVLRKQISICRELHIRRSHIVTACKVPWNPFPLRVLLRGTVSWTKELKTQSNLGSRTPRIMNNSVYEQIFLTQSVWDDVLCLELRTRKPSTSWSDKLGVSASAVFVEERYSGKYPESATPIGESVSCCLYLFS